ncbi:sodium/solute symporter [Sphingobacterium sp. UT-1RO-CII-1]|uniref:sodium:solute symporter family transporter n=1 Tax=Sphingobacterium sp. UT-1RO-CII-1 TaxID=2995225 RepID=UPI00227A3A95|nr:sodium/solute symporter [Sphingobacterium sp. UT-1RO-CII-1]MCY4780643.1 sodium/solute symporter [Sphingobacterium sp. UT-1RO-CII-1]
MLSWIDQIIFMLYFVLVGGYGYYIYKKKSSSGSLSHDFFLAEGSLAWWAIGASIIASNISAEQFIGMSGSGFAVGIAIASYEWMAAVGLIIVAYFFLPIYLKNKIYTMPEFLRKRFDARVSMIMAVFWVLVYVFVNLSSILYLGALAIHAIVDIPFIWCVWVLAVLAAVIALGGMKVIGYTDVIQVVLLIIGGLTTTYVAVSLVADSEGLQGWWQGLSVLRDEVPSHFHMFIEKGQLIKPDGGDAYMDLPGWSVIIGGMWIMNLSYWGCNQYITQRALGAKDLKTAQQGMLFAAFLKLLIPLIVVLPGIAAFYLYQNGTGVFAHGMLDSGVVKPDKAYPLLLSILPTGFKGMAFAALTAAIVASLAGKVNSIATIVSLDIYKHIKNDQVSEETLVKLGKYAIVISLFIGAALAPLLSNLDQGFQFIQEFTGFITPGVLAIFLMGILTNWTTANAALAGAVSTFFYSLVFKNFWLNELPFMNRILVVFIFTVLTMIFVSFIDRKRARNSGIVLKKEMFLVSDSFKIISLLIIGIVTALYIVLW